MIEASGDSTHHTTPLIPRTRSSRWFLSCLIVVFFSFHLWLSVRSAILQDDRYGWRMFHNVGFTRVDYSWIVETGERRRFRPKKKDVVKRGYKLVASDRWHITLYSAGAAHESVKNYVHYMGQEERRPPGATAFEARLRVRINKEKVAKTYFYRYPQAPE